MREICHVVAILKNKQSLKYTNKMDLLTSLISGVGFYNPCRHQSNHSSKQLMCIELYFLEWVYLY